MFKSEYSNKTAKNYKMLVGSYTKYHDHENDNYQ